MVSDKALMERRKDMFLTRFKNPLVLEKLVGLEFSYELRNSSTTAPALIQSTMQSLEITNKFISTFTSLHCISEETSFGK